jgi:integrase/recombinase XerD
MKFITPEDYQHLHTRLTTRAHDNNRDAVMLLLTLDLGLRSQELLNLTRADIDFDLDTILIRTLKGGMPRVLPAPKYLIKYLLTRAHDNKVINAPIFDICRQRLFQIWSEWRIKDYKFHSLRHTFARRLYKKGKDIRLVQKTLGHKSLASTTIYLDEEYSIETLKKAMGVK